jgi:hypothetical protein
MYDFNPWLRSLPQLFQPQRQHNRCIWLFLLRRWCSWIFFELLPARQVWPPTNNPAFMRSLAGGLRDADGSDKLSRLRGW